MSSAIQLVTPFPPEHYELLFGWLQQFPSQNFDDAGPRNYVDFVNSMASRVVLGHTFYEVVHGGQPVGVIAITIDKFLEPRGKFCGICFDKAVHGHGVALEAVRMVLRKTFAAGIRSVVAIYFADNIAVRKMFQKLGQHRVGGRMVHVARDVCRFSNPVPRNGKPVECVMVVIDGAAFRANDKPPVGQSDHDAAANVRGVA